MDAIAGVHSQAHPASSRHAARDRRGFAAGAFASFTPLMGFHFILAALLAFATRGNIIASAFGTFVGNPLTFPLIWGATYSLGARILGSGGKHSEATELHSHLTWSNFSLEAVWPLVWPMIVGGVILGALVWVLMYFPIRAMIASYQNKRAARISRREAATQAAE